MGKRKLAITTSICQHRTCPFWLWILFSSFLNPSIAQGPGMFSVYAGIGVGRQQPEELFIRTKMYFKKPFSPEDNSYWKT